MLEKIEVPLKVELPGVGENVQEHYFVGLSWGAPQFDHIYATHLIVRHRTEG